MTKKVISEEKNWSEITNEESYRLSMAEFKGASIQALQDLDKRISGIEVHNRDTRIVSLVISGVSGVLAGFFGVNINK